MKKLTIILSCCTLSSCSFDAYKSQNQDRACYFDYASSWDINETSLGEFLLVSRLAGNSSGINKYAKFLRQLEARSAIIVAEKISCAPDQIHFTSGATAANNIAILGVAYRHPSCHLIASKIEHKSILDIFKHLESRGHKVSYLDVDKYGNVDLNQLRKCIRNDTKLISIQMFNSEIGALQDVEEIGKIAKARGVYFHTDAAQSFGKYDIDVSKMNIDLLTISGHKIGAPKGVGVLYVRDIAALQPIMFGSGDTLSPGTKPTALICAFAKAIQTFKFNKKQITRNYEALVSALSKIEKIYINSSTLSHIVSVSIEGVLLKDILDRMKDYSFSAGCSCLGQDKSNVIAAIDPDEKLPTCTLRISFSDQKSEKQLIDFAGKLKIIVEQLRTEKSVGKGCESAPNDQQQDLQNSLDEIQKMIRNHVPR